MEKFQRVICKLAETHPNAPLTPAARTFLLDRLSQFVSEYKTPDHPPYSAMIERAISELNEKRGSSEDSISRFLQKEYNNLPWAHSSILKHHLQNLCASSFIIMTHKKRYKLPGKNKFLITSSPHNEVNNSEISKTKPPRRRTRCGKHRKKLIKVKFKGKIVAVIEKNKEHDELDEVTLLQTNEDDVSAVRALEQPQGQQPKKSPRFQSPENLTNPDTTELSVELNLKEQEIGLSKIMDDDVSASHTQEIGNPDTTELPVEQQEIGNPGPTELPIELNLKEQEIGLSKILDDDVSAAHTQEIGNPDTTELPIELNLKEIGLSKIMDNDDVSAAHAQKQSERQQSEHVENLPNSERPSEVSLQQFEHSQPEIPSFELHSLENLHNELPNEVNLLQQETDPSEITKPDFSAAHRVQNSPNPPPTQLEPKELFNSERERRQLRRWNKRHLNQSYSGPILSGVFNLETPQVSVVEQIQLENDVKSVGEVENDVKSVRGADLQVTPDADYTVPSQHYPTSEPISSDPSNFSTLVSSQQQEIVLPDITYRRRRKMNSKQSEIIVTDEKEPRQVSKEHHKEISRDKQPQPRRSLRLHSSKPEIIDVDANNVISLPSQTYCLRSEPSKEKSVNQKRASKPMNLDDGGAEAEKSSTQHVGRPQQDGKLLKRGRGRPRG